MIPTNQEKYIYIYAFYNIRFIIIYWPIYCLTLLNGMYNNPKIFKLQIIY